MIRFFFYLFFISFIIKFIKQKNIKLFNKINNIIKINLYLKINR